MVVSIDATPGRNTVVRTLDLGRSRNVLMMLLSHLTVKDGLASHGLALGRLPMNSMLLILALKCDSRQILTTPILFIAFLEAETAT